LKNGIIEKKINNKITGRGNLYSSFSRYRAGQGNRDQSVRLLPCRLRPGSCCGRTRWFGQT
jgi:hypothetical protein